MTNDARFGLSLSLVEALRVDPSADAATLADLLADEAPARRAAPPRARHGHSWGAAFAGLGLAAGLGAQSLAATPTMEGAWAMAPSQSSFQEAVTGPAPDRATVVVTRDDRDRLAYELVESRRGSEVARGAYDVSFKGAPSTSMVEGSTLKVTAERDARGDVVIRAPPVAGLQALIRVRRTGRDTALLEHEVQGAAGALKVERISLVRTDPLSN